MVNFINNSVTTVVVILTTSLINANKAPDPKVETENGTLEGIILTTSSNRSVHAFLGIPYAKAPVGKLRFRPPLDPEKWQGLRGAKRQPPSCLQRKDLFFADFKGPQETQPMVGSNEDCLYLNVFVPKSSKRTRNNRVEGANGLPVIVYIHGGFFSSGSSLPQGQDETEWVADPRELAANDKVIVVTIQYRLGSFGFLFIGDEDAPGNVGLADQHKALEWVKNNIEKFGGNKEAVAVMGQDAGGVSAMILCAKTRIFNRVILLSSGIQHPWSYVNPREMFKRTLHLADLVGCPARGSKQDVVDCLRNVDPQEILRKEVGTSPPSLNFSPFVLTRDGVYLTHTPQDLLTRVDLEGLSVMVGSNKDAGTKSAMYFLPRLFPNANLSLGVMTNKVFEDSIERMLENVKSKEIVEVAKYLYKNWTFPDNEKIMLESLITLINDHQFECPVNFLSSALVEQGVPVFRFLFAQENPYSLWPKWTGVSLGTEFEYIFGRPVSESFLLNTKFTASDVNTSEFMMNSLSNFAIYGIPATGQGITSGSIGWPRYDNKNRFSLQIGHVTKPNDMIIEANKNEEKCGFWNDLAPKLAKNHLERCNEKDKVRKVNRTKFLPIKVRTRKTTVRTTTKTTTRTTIRTTTKTKTTITTTTTTTTRTTATNPIAIPDVWVNPVQSNLVESQFSADMNTMFYLKEKDKAKAHTRPKRKNFIRFGKGGEDSMKVGYQMAVMNTFPTGRPKEERPNTARNRNNNQFAVFTPKFKGSSPVVVKPTVYKDRSQFYPTIYEGKSEDLNKVIIGDLLLRTISTTTTTKTTTRDTTARKTTVRERTTKTTTTKATTTKTTTKAATTTKATTTRTVDRQPTFVPFYDPFNPSTYYFGTNNAWKGRTMTTSMPKTQVETVGVNYRYFPSS